MVHSQLYVGESSTSLTAVGGLNPSLTIGATSFYPDGPPYKAPHVVLAPKGRDIMWGGGQGDQFLLGTQIAKNLW